MASIDVFVSDMIQLEEAVRDDLSFSLGLLERMEWILSGSSLDVNALGSVEQYSYSQCLGQYRRPVLILLDDGCLQHA